MKNLAGCKRKRISERSYYEQSHYRFDK